MPSDLITNLHRDNLSYWQESIAVDKHATPRQQSLWSKGALPDSELLDIARRELFQGLTSFVKRRRLEVWHIPHPRTPLGWICADYLDAESMVEWETREADPTTVEWMTLLRIRQATYTLTEHPWLARSANPVTVDVREHCGTCNVCGRTVSNRSALVSVQWAGRTLSREYLL